MQHKYATTNAAPPEKGNGVIAGHACLAKHIDEATTISGIMKNERCSPDASKDAFWATLRFPEDDVISVSFFRTSFRDRRPRNE
jgi:hypothetical protein